MLISGGHLMWQDHIYRNITDITDIMDITDITDITADSDPILVDILQCTLQCSAKKCLQALKLR